jgi:riboflavin kinase/FMN adenylyltransferase
MDVFPGHLAMSRPLRQPAVAIGNFDGVHLGHQRLLAAARAAAGASGESAVLTFEPHPVRVLAPQLAPPLLVTPARKLELIAAQGIDACVVEPFTAELAASSPAWFVEELLVRGLGARHIVVGYDFTYGQKRAGTVDSLRAAGRQHGFDVEVVNAVAVDGLVASSTKVREFVLEGNVAGAAMLLGRPFDVDGKVVRGAGRGRTIGVPTANVVIDGELLPRPGVYAARVQRLGAGTGAGAADGAWYDAAVNLGTNPTFVAGGALSLEAHLLDFDADLYDSRLRVAFVARLRDERRFTAIDELVAQIRRDIAAVREAARTRTPAR